MAEKRLVVSNETKNSRGFVVLNGGIDWGRYLKNPVLLKEHNAWQDPIGRLEDIRLEGGNWTARPVFSDSDDGRDAKKLFDENILIGASIGGRAEKVTREKDVYATRFEVFEVSLVSIPANEDAVAYEAGKLHVDFREMETAVWNETLSASDDALINNFISKTMEKEVKPQEVAVQQQLDGMGAASVETPKPETAPEILKATPAPAPEPAPAATPEPEVLSNDVPEPSWVKKLMEQLSALFGKEKAVEAPAPEIDPEPEKTDLSAATAATVKPEEKVELTPNPEEKLFSPQPKTAKQRSMKPESILSWVASDEGKEKLAAVADLSRRIFNHDTLSSNPENATTQGFLQEFGVKLQNDPVMMEFLKDFHFTTGEGAAKRSESVPQFAERLASGYDTADFVENTPDLGVAVWLSLFLKQLLPDNSWAARTLKVSGSDKRGLIWAQSAANPAIYFGGRAPRNATIYEYDDNPRSIVTNVFAVQPTLWQPSNTDILAYDNRSAGIGEEYRLLAEAIHQYSLQRYGEEAGEIVPMTGGPISAVGAFPNLNPAAAGNMTTPSTRDLATLTAKFINENFNPEMYAGVLILDAIPAAEFKLDPRVTSILEKNAGGVGTTYQEWDAWHIYSRSRVLAYDTASSAVIDPEWYLDGRTGADGTIAPYTPPVIPGSALGAGLAFMPQQAIMGMGNTHVHVVIRPEDYGFLFSCDMRYGAGLLRANGVGAKVLAPTVPTP